MIRKFSLQSQLAEVDRELKKRKGVYQNEVFNRRMSQAEADMHMDLMRNVRVTLEWLRENEKDIKGYIGALNAAPELKGKRPLVLFFEDDAAADEMVAAIKAERPDLIARRF